MQVLLKKIKKNSIISLLANIWTAVFVQKVQKNGVKSMDTDIMANIEQCYPRMTKKQRQIAGYIKDNADMMTFITLKELSRELGVTEITILNACRVLGYNSFNEVKYEVRKYINMSRRIGLHQQNDYFNTDVPEYELNDKEQLLTEICREERELMEEYARNFDSRRLMDAAKLFWEYPKIILCGRGLSHIICRWMASDLAGAQIGSVLVDTELHESVYSALPVIRADTLLLAVSFPDHYFMTEKLAGYGRKKGAKVLVITDTPEAEITRHADELLTVRSTTRLFLNTASAPMAMVNLLMSAVKIEGDMEKENIGKEFGTLF